MDSHTNVTCSWNSNFPSDPSKTKCSQGPKETKILLPWTPRKVSNKISRSPFMGWPIIWSWWYEGIEMSLNHAWSFLNDSREEDAGHRYHTITPLNEEVLGLGNTSNIPMPDAPVPLQVARNSLWPQNCDPALWAADSGWGSPRKTWTSVATWNTWVASNLAPWCSIFFHMRMSHNPSPNIHDKIA